MRRIALVALFLVGCSTSGAPPESPAPETPDTPAPETADTPVPAGGRERLSAQDCEKKGGSVVGDIGDGATQRPDYRCPSGGAPLGDIVAPEAGPMGVEGSVCCPKG
jgi:hypothetical protein